MWNIIQAYKQLERAHKLVTISIEKWLYKLISSWKRANKLVTINIETMWK